MVSELKSLFDLRRDAEDTAKRALATAVRALDKEKEEHERLTGRWQAACATVEREGKRLSAGPGPATAAQARAREGYLARLREDASRRKAAVEEHRMVTLVASQAAHDQALASYERAVADRKAVSRLRQRSAASKAKAAARRAEDAASDLAGRRRR
jgi:hypothetical protein